MKCRLFAINRDQPSNKVKEVLLAIVELPIQPGDLVVLAVGIIVPALCVADLIAREQHGNTLRENQCRQKGPLLLFTELDNLGIVCRTFSAAVPAIVVVSAVAVFFAVGLVVFVVVRHEIVEREAIMARDEVNAGVRTAATPFVEVAGTADARGKFGS